MDNPPIPKPPFKALSVALMLNLLLSLLCFSVTFLLLPRPPNCFRLA